MNKTPAEWAKVQPAMVTAGSVAQATNVLQMALDDIAEIGAALSTIRGFIETEFVEGEKAYQAAIVARNVLSAKIMAGHDAAIDALRRA